MKLKPPSAACSASRADNGVSWPRTNGAARGLRPTASSPARASVVELLFAWGWVALRLQPPPVCWMAARKLTADMTVVLVIGTVVRGSVSPE